MDFRSSPQSVAVFAPELASIPAARLFVQRPAEEFVAHRVDDILLAASELASNAVEHGSSEPFDVHFVRQGDAVELTVSSAIREGSSQPLGGVPTTGEKIPRSGRGLGIVEAISDSFEVHRENGRFRARCRFNLSV